MKYVLVSLGLLFLVACSTPRHGSNDYTLNSSRVKSKPYSRGTASARPQNRSARPSNTGFLDAVESRGNSSAQTAMKATTHVENSAVKADEDKELISVPPIESTSANTTSDMVVGESAKLLGVKYRYAGDSPSRGFDCSGFTCYVFSKQGVKLPRTSSEQARIGKRKKFDQAEPGDLVFFGTGNRVTHVAIVADRTKNSMIVVHSTSSGGVRQDEVYSSRYWNSRRLWAVDHKSLMD